MKPGPCLFALLALVCLSLPALALETTPYTPERFQALQQEGTVILIDIHAPWCPTCAKQQQVLENYRRHNPDKQFHILRVDFDKDKQWVREFRAPRQSTLLLYRGQEQLWYSVAETRAEVISAALDQAVSGK